MPDTKECPLCGGSMHYHETETQILVPGNPNATTQTTREWVCPDCDYFEDADGDSE